nr:MAG TPA: cytosine DNA methyltransferase [Caudoviricetes sp.]
MSNNKSLRVLSLFSGCGGMDLGFEGDFNVLSASYNKNLHPDWKVKKSTNGNWIRLAKTSFQTVFANDIRTDAKTAWCSYFSKRGRNPSVYHIESIVDLVKEAKNGKNVFPNNIDIVTGGFPCQDFSIAGKRKGFSSDKSHDGCKIVDHSVASVESRGSLYIWMKEVISIVQPKIFVAENVKGLTNLANAKKIIEEDFKTACDNGYLVVNARVLHAADYGVPQSRERVIFLGFKKSALTPEAIAALSSENVPELYDPYPIVTHAYHQHYSELMPVVTTQDAFIDLNEPDDTDDYDQKTFSKAKYMGNHCQGQNEVNLAWIGPTIRSEHHGNIEFRRLSKEHGGKHEQELSRGLPERRLSVRECARIQTFPDDYKFILDSTNSFGKVSSSQAYQLIGNAVPPYLAYNLAKRLEENWNLYFKDKK